MELKIASTIKRKDRLVKKLKAIFWEGAVEEEEEEQGQGPLALTQGMGKDAKEEEGVEQDVPKIEPKNRKTQKPPTS